jgi:hypothetical protein
MVLTTNYKEQNSRKVIIDALSARTVARDGNCLFRSFSILLEDEGRHNMLRQKAKQYVFNVSDSQTIHPPTTIVGQLCSERSLSVLYIRNQQHYPLKFQQSLC